MMIGEGRLTGSGHKRGPAHEPISRKTRSKTASGSEPEVRAVTPAQAALRADFAGVCAPPHQPNLLTELPREMLQKIGEHLPGVFDVGAYAATCRNLRQIIEATPVLEQQLRPPRFLHALLGEQFCTSKSFAQAMQHDRRRAAALPHVVTPALVQRLGSAAKYLAAGHIESAVLYACSIQAQDDRVRAMQALVPLYHRLTMAQKTDLIHTALNVRASTARLSAIEHFISHARHFDADHYDLLLDATNELRDAEAKSKIVIAFAAQANYLSATQIERLGGITDRIHEPRWQMQARAALVFGPGRSDDNFALVRRDILVDATKGRLATLHVLCNLFGRLDAKQEQPAVLKAIAGLRSEIDFARSLQKLTPGLKTVSDLQLLQILAQVTTIVDGDASLAARSALVDLLPQLDSRPVLQMQMLTGVLTIEDRNQAAQLVKRLANMCLDLPAHARTYLLETAATEIHEPTRADMLGNLLPNLGLFIENERRELVGLVRSVEFEAARARIYQRVGRAFKHFTAAEREASLNDIAEFGISPLQSLTLRKIAPHLRSFEPEERAQILELSRTYFGKKDGQRICAALALSYGSLKNVEREELLANLKRADLENQLEGFLGLAKVSAELQPSHLQIVKTYSADIIALEPPRYAELGRMLGDLLAPVKAMEPPIWNGFRSGPLRREPKAT